MIDLEKKLAAILGFHAFTGTDMTGKFARRLKETCYIHFLSADDDILKSLLSTSFPDETVISHLVRFVCIPYLCMYI